MVVDAKDSDAIGVSHVLFLMPMPNLELGLQRSIAAQTLERSLSFQEISQT